MTLNRLIIERFSTHPETIGQATYGDFQCFTIERPWLQNKSFVSCIPPNIYKCKKITSPSNGECFEILDVPNRTDIQGHIANYVRNVVGCVGFGDSIRRSDKDGRWVSNSSKTFKKLMSLLPDEFELVIG